MWYSPQGSDGVHIGGGHLLKRASSPSADLLKGNRSQNLDEYLHFSSAFVRERRLGGYSARTENTEGQTESTWGYLYMWITQEERKEEHPPDLKSGRKYKGHSLWHSTNKGIAFHASIWSALPVQTCWRSICSPEGWKQKKGPVSTSLSRDRTSFIRPWTLRSLPTKPSVIWRKGLSEKNLLQMKNVSQVHCSNCICLFSYSTVQKRKKRQNRSWTVNSAGSFISIRWLLDMMMH